MYFKEIRKLRLVAACFALMKARLSRMILHSVAAVSHLSLGVPLMFIYPLALRAGQLSTDSVESLCVSFLVCGKKGVCGKDAIAG